LDSRCLVLSDHGQPIIVIAATAIFAELTSNSGGHTCRMQVELAAVDKRTTAWVWTCTGAKAATFWESWRSVSDGRLSETELRELPTRSDQAAPEVKGSARGPCRARFSSPLAAAHVIRTERPRMPPLDQARYGSIN